MAQRVHVAVGVILNEDGAILIAKRPAKTHQGGLWEFPGGKVEVGETVFAALKRELQEELAITILTSQPLIKICHDYGDKIVLLDVHKVSQFSGNPQGNEGQPIRWVTASQLYDLEFPAANRPIITALNLPQHMLITGDARSHSDFLARTERALQQGIRLVQLRIQDPATRSALLAEFCALCRRYSARVQVNTAAHLFPLSESCDIGLHLNSQHLLQCESRPVANNIWLSASCHNRAEIAHAQTIGVDFICLSPVLATASHPCQQPLGWQKFAEMVERATVPVFALGGMKDVDMQQAVAAGAQGIAGISQWWS